MEICWTGFLFIFLLFSYQALRCGSSLQSKLLVLAMRNSLLLVHDRDGRMAIFQKQRRDKTRSPNRTGEIIGIIFAPKKTDLATVTVACRSCRAGGLWPAGNNCKNRSSKRLSRLHFQDSLACRGVKLPPPPQTRNAGVPKD